MKKIILAIGLLVNLLVFEPIYANTGTYEVKQKDIYEGYAVQKIWLDQFAVPDVTLSDITYTTGVVLPGNAKLSDPNKFQVEIGMERKRPFVVVRIPAYTAGDQPGAVKMVSNFTLAITEKPQQKTAAAARTTDVTTSALASGTWYKIAVTQTGFYKIDYAFLTSMGITPANVNPANIRVFGNGGVMLSENNAVSRPTDLIENAILVNDNGNGVFDNGESAIFYAVGPTGWFKDSIDQRFTHLKNLYTDTAYYFITFDQGPGLRITTQPAIGAGNVSVSSFNYYDAHDTDEVNPPQMGKIWYGEQFYPQLGNTTQTFSFNFGTTVSSVYCYVAFGCTQDVPGSGLSVTTNGGSSVGSTIFATATPTGGDQLMTYGTIGGNGACNSQTANVTIDFSPIDGTGVGYLDYIEINARRSLIMTGDQMSFRDWQSVGAGNVATYQLQGANSNTSVWDVTNAQVPVLMNGSLSGSTYSFTQNAQMLHEFAAMNSSNLFTPNYIGTVVNQNLHGSGQVDGIIVTYPGFLDQANELADYHRQHDNMRIIVATTDQVYNEFSSGGQDLSAIRDFAKMFYNRAGSDSTQMPRNIVLLGGASYDYKNRLPNNSDYVPVFESAESLNDLIAFSSDDFFGMLDDNEYIENDTIINALDIGVGRLPARSVSDAISLVNKAINYTSPATLGPWRLASTFVACPNDDAGAHMADAETMAATVTSCSAGLYNEDKVYEDAIPMVSTPAGSRCPNANAEIDNDVYKGVFLINYNGHGNPDVWSFERILTEDDYNNWNNANMLPLMVTATCDFGQFDQPQFVSAAEQIVKRNGGGAIALLTTTQAVYAIYNDFISTQYFTAQFTRNGNGTWNTFGEATRIGKNVTYLASGISSGELANFRKFALLGDPMLTPDFPQYTTSIDSVTDGVTLARADTVKALGSYVVNGSVHDNNGNVLTGFTGLLSVSFFDKPTIVSTIDGATQPPTFKLQQNLVYKGLVSVTNGLYSFTFIAPKDINYYYGAGKISTYANNGVTDAAGVDTSFAVGGFSDNPQYNSNPPIVRPYINDSLFLNGGITGGNTSLFVSLYDQTGINVTGNMVGHDLTAVLDGNIETPYVLNDYYETAPNTYQRGYVSFPIAGIANGHHSITVKAWDVNDNEGEGTVDFIVIDSQVVAIQNLMNYPNPFSNTTNFVFEENQPNEQLNVSIEIFNVTGAFVKKIDQVFTPSDSRTNEITWDGTDNNGARLPSGVYVYRLMISTDQGFKSSAYQKLVIVR